jgi:predicted enzyme related to lactoylglutathione lyase
MSTNVGKFVWYELITSDPKAAESFYRSVIGWETKDAGMPNMAYTLLSAGPSMVGGLMAIPEEVRAMGVPPCWTGYIHVDDVDAFAKRLVAAGGAIRRPAQDIPNVGRFAVVADPHGAVFMLFKGSMAQAPPPVPAGTTGHVGWHELYAGNLDQAWAFYSGLFGWTKADSMDMGPMGTYQIFATEGGVPDGGMMNKPPQMPFACWTYYFNVDAADTAIARIKAGGGKITNGPQQVPGGSWIVQATDPQGAAFAIVAPKR